MGAEDLVDDGVVLLRIPRPVDPSAVLGRLPLMGPLFQRWMGPTQEVNRSPPLREVLTFDGTPVRPEKEKLP